ncbi:MAG: hypothetical protein QN196_03415 [Armatimonadota bacterium]|nr:hypothetical protein [Armatimonadota bacterium]
MNSLAPAGTSRVLWAVAWAAAAAARAALLWAPGHPADLAAFHAWALRLAEVGPWRFYAPGQFADYLPGYLALLWPLGFLVHAWPGAAGPLLKAVPASADFAVAALLWRLGGTRGQAAAAAYLWNPAVLLAGAWWGQAESVSVAWLLGGAVALHRGNPGWAGVLFGWAALTKPQYAAAGTLLLLSLVRGRAGLRTLAWSAGSCALTVTAGGLLFGLSPVGLARLAVSASTTYPYGSVNALNLWYLTGLNWKPDTLPVLGVASSVWGLVLASVAIAWVAWRVAARGDPALAALGASAVCVVVFAVATRMHERYLFPALPLALAAWARGYSGAALWVALSVVLLANLAYGFAYAASFPQYATPPWSALWPVLSGPASYGAALATVLLAGWSLYAAASAVRRGRGC